MLVFFWLNLQFVWFSFYLKRRLFNYQSPMSGGGAPTPGSPVMSTCCLEWVILRVFPSWNPTYTSLKNADIFFGCHKETTELAEKAHKSSIPGLSKIREEVLRDTSYQ